MLGGSSLRDAARPGEWGVAICKGHAALGRRGVGLSLCGLLRLFKEPNEPSL